MEAEFAKTRRIFKVMMPGFKEKLNLPPAFCKKLSQVKSESAMIRTPKGMWKVNVCRNREGLISFKGGWPAFVHHYDLNVGDFIVFEHTGELHFNAFVFDPRGCEKVFPVELKKQHEVEPEEVHDNHYPQNNKREPTKESDFHYHSQNPHFILRIKPYHALKNGRPLIPTEFVKSNDFMKITRLTLKDSHDIEWRVRVVRERKTRKSYCRMSGGWYEFYASKKLKDGDVCVFELKRTRSASALMEVKILRAPLG